MIKHFALMCLCVFTMGISSAIAQPAMSAAPKPVMSSPTVKPTEALAAKPAAMAAPMEAVPAPMQPTMAAAPKKAPEKSSDKKKSSDIMDMVFKILVLVLGGVFTLLKYFDKLGWAKWWRQEKVQNIFTLAYDAVEGLAKKTENKIDDKLLEFLKRANEMLVESGEKEMSPEEKKVAAKFAENQALADKKSKE